MPIRAEDVKMSSANSFLLKGRTGSGKSVAAWGKEFRPVYTFDMENRIEGAIHYYKKLDGHVRDCEYDVFPMGRSWHDLDSRMEELMRSCPYKTLHVGTLTSYIHYILKHLIVTKGSEKNQQGQSKGKSIGGIPVNTLEDYNAEDAGIIFELMQFLQTMKSQGVNVILEAHITPYEIKDGSGSEMSMKTVYEILTKGKKGPAQVPGYFNEVYLLERAFEGMVIGAQTHKFLCNPVGDRTNDCKTSWDIKPFEWTNKDFSVELYKQVSDEIKTGPKSDGNIKKMVSF
jgi:hypothetical protein